MPSNNTATGISTEDISAGHSGVSNTEGQDLEAFRNEWNIQKQRHDEETRENRQLVIFGFLVLLVMVATLIIMILIEWTNSNDRIIDKLVEIRVIEPNVELISNYGLSR